MAGLLKEKRRLIGAAAGFYRIAGVVPDVTGDAIAAGFQAVAVSLQATKSGLNNPILLRGDRPGVALSHVGEDKIRRLQGFQVIQGGAHVAPF